MPKFTICTSFYTLLMTVCVIFSFQSGRAEVNELDLRVFNYLNMGSNCLNTGNCNCAIFYFNKVLEINPRFVEAYYSRASAWIIIGEPDRAIADCTKALEINPKCIKAYNNRGVAWLKKENYRHAISDFDLALKINQHDVNALRNRGAAWLKKGDYNRAVADFDSVLRIDPQNAGTYGHRGIAKWKQGKTIDACNNWNLACQLGDCKLYMVSKKRRVCQ
jgi:tetratricopeptide (TPR) repeat protein